MPFAGHTFESVTTSVGEVSKVAVVADLGHRDVAHDGRVYAFVVAVVVLVLTWVAFVIVLAVARPHGIDLAESKRLVPDVLRLLRALAGDNTLPRSVRWRLRMLIAYLASPIDLVPDFIPVLGYADDVIVVALVLRSVVRRAGATSVTNHWQGSEPGLAILRSLCGIPA